MSTNKGEKKEEVYPLTIVMDRYNGSYSGAKYLAFNLYPEDDIFIEFIGGSDPQEMDFWYDGYHKNYKIGKGSTPDEALKDLLAKF